MAEHLSKFEGGVSKIAWGVNPKYSEIGPQGGHFVMPKSVADDVISRAGGHVPTIEKLLGLPKGELGNAPVRIDIPNPTGLRMPSGNELGANDFWVPGGYTSGGIPEAAIDPTPLAKAIISKI